MISAYRILIVVLVSLSLAAAYNRWLSPNPIPWIRPPRPNLSGSIGPTTGTSSTAPAAAEMTVEDIKRAIESGLVRLIDARPRKEYEEGHIPTAVNLPFDEVKTDPSLVYQEGLREEEDIIVYCTGPNCDESRNLAELLYERMNFKKVRDFSGGIEAWTAAREELERP